jgi:hypothetical protein
MRAGANQHAAAVHPAAAAALSKSNLELGS